MICYLGSFDVIGRMAKASPFIPYEVGKYLLFILFLYGIVTKKGGSNIGALLILLICPAFFYDFSNQVQLTDLINYGLGPLILGMSVFYFYNKKLSIEVVLNCLKIVLYSSIMVLTFAVFKTPDYDELEFALGANFTTTGGFGPNQVANVLGLGVLALFINIMFNKSIAGKRVFDILLLFALMFQALLTFSRGGVFTTVLAIILFVFFSPRNTYETGILKINRNKMMQYLFLFSISALGIFYFVNSITDNFLLMRYQGETLGIQAGVKEKNISTLTSTRYDLVLSEFAIWIDNPILGVGVGASKYLRSEYIDLNNSSHTELSRLFADHGLPGIAFQIIWISLFFTIWKKNKGENRALLLTIFIFAFVTSLHSAMRVFITPILTGFSLISINLDNVKRVDEDRVIPNLT
jgi:hypothetical protein